MIDWNNCNIEELTLSRKKETLNCPNCAAPIESEKCPYCGTVFVDFASMDVEHPFYMKIKRNDETFIFKVRLTSAEFKQESDVSYDCPGYLYCTHRSMTMEFDIL